MMRCRKPSEMLKNNFNSPIMKSAKNARASITRMTSHLLLFAALSLAAFVFLLAPETAKSLLLRPLTNKVLSDDTKNGLVMSGDSLKIALFSGEYCDYIVYDADCLSDLHFGERNGDLSYAEWGTKAVREALAQSTAVYSCTIVGSEEPEADGSHPHYRRAKLRVKKVLHFVPQSVTEPYIVIQSLRR